MSLIQFARIKHALSRRPIALAAAAAFVAMLFAAGYLKEREAELLHVAEPVGVVVAARDIARGEVVDEGNVASRAIPRRYVEPGAFENSDMAAGRIAFVPIRKGAQLTRATARRASRIAGLASLIPAGKRAFTIAIDDVAGVAGIIKPNDMVDVIATVDLGTEASVHRTTLAVVENVQVLAVGKELADALPARHVEEEQGIFSKRLPAIASREGMTATLAVTPAEAQVLAFVQESGAVALALRPFADESGEDTPPTTIATITGSHEQLLPMKRGFREYRGR